MRVRSWKWYRLTCSQRARRRRGARSGGRTDGTKSATAARATLRQPQAALTQPAVLAHVACVCVCRVVCQLHCHHRESLASELEKRILLLLWTSVLLVTHHTAAPPLHTHSLCTSCACITRAV